MWTEIALPDLTVTDWRAAATSTASGLYAVLTRHPWLVRAFGPYPVFGPVRARLADHGLAIYDGAGFSGAQADQAAASVFTFVLGNALGRAAGASLTRKLRREGGNAEELMRDSIAKAREVAMQFPRLRAGLDTPAAGYGAAPEGSFEIRPPGDPRRPRRPTRR